MKYRKLRGYKYEIMDCEKFQTDILGMDKVTGWFSLDEDGVLLVYKHYCYDGPSGPTIDTANFMRGALAHDVLYQMMREGLLPRLYRKYADQLLRQICLEDGMSRFRAWYVYKAVRMFSKKSSLPRKNPRGQIIEI